MNESQRVAAAFYEMRRFFENVSRLLEESDQIFEDAGWTRALAENYCFRGPSTMLGNASKWLPTRFFRSYRNGSQAGWVAYTSVLIDLPADRETEDGTAIISCGALHAPEIAGRPLRPAEHSWFYHWHVHRHDRTDDGSARWHKHPFEWKNTVPQTLKTNADGLTKAITTALPLHEIQTGEHLKYRVIQPVMESVLNQAAV